MIFKNKIHCGFFAIEIETDAPRNIFSILLPVLFPFLFQL